MVREEERWQKQREKTKSAQRYVKYETVADMGSGLVIAKVKLTDFREQDINARIMKTRDAKRLTDNIKKQGQLESLPFCALIDGKIEDYLRPTASVLQKDSGVLTELFVILDTTTGLRRSQSGPQSSWRTTPSAAFD